jgi:hypothetical protein
MFKQIGDVIGSFLFGGFVNRNKTLEVKTEEPPVQEDQSKKGTLTFSLVFCPFCGNVNEKKFNIYKNAVGCGSCGSLGPVGEDVHQSVAKWNSRVHKLKIQDNK